MNKFLDEVIIDIASGDGGNGALAWRREKYEPMGGPAGGNGGRGGNVYLVATRDMRTLLDFHYKTQFEAPHGQKSGSKNKTGRAGEDLIIKVPVGTVVSDVNSQKVIADLTSEDTLQLARHPRLFKYLKGMIAKYGHKLPNIQIPVTSYIDLDKIPVKYFGSAKNFMESDPLALKTISLRALQSLASTEIPKPVSQIKVPVMVLQGTADSIFPVSYTQKIFDKLNCRKKLALFPDRSHAVLHEDIEGVVPVVTNWLQDTYHANFQHQLNA